MQIRYFVLLVLLSSWACAHFSSRSDEEMFDDFQAFAKMYNKQYASGDEMMYRFENFKQSLKRIEERTKAFPNGATYGINKFSDLTPEEFRGTYLMQNKINPVLQRQETSNADANDLPASIDWRDHGIVTPVKDQGDCGSCWAFSATETIESAWIRAGKSTADKLALAPQQLVDCDHFALGCNGGIPGGAFHNVMVNGGQEAESSYPYQAEVGWCRFNKSLAVAKIKGWKYATEVADETDLKKSLATVGPVSICLDAMNWQDYTGGVMTASECAWINLLDRVVEVELMGAFKSTKLLEELKEKGARSIDIWPTPSIPATPLTCLVLKASHITFPINWRKTAAHLSEMKTWFKADSLNSLIESDPQCELFKQLFDVRSKETLARYLSKTKSRAVSNADLKEKKASLLDEQDFLKFAPVDQSDTIYFPTTDTSVSKSKFISGSAEYKLEVVQRQLELIAGLYFVDHPALMQLSREARATEIYLLALQTFCCQQVAAEMPVNNQHSLAKKTYHVYERFREVPAYHVDEVLELARKLTVTDVTELPLPSDEQVSASPLGNPVIQWLVDHWTESILVPSQSFKDFVARHSTEHQKPNDIVLPPELMEMIFGHIDEHVTYCSLISLNKYYRTLYNSNEAWKRLVEKCWTEDQLKYSEVKEQPPSSKKEKRKQQQIRWREIFVEMYDRALKESFVLCGHCHSFHDAVAHKEGRDEAYWDHCACKECDAGSWSTCMYADEYTWAD